MAACSLKSSPNGVGADCVNIESLVLDISTDGLLPTLTRDLDFNREMFEYLNKPVPSQPPQGKQPPTMQSSPALSVDNSLSLSIPGHSSAASADTASSLTPRRLRGGSRATKFGEDGVIPHTLAAVEEHERRAIEDLYLQVSTVTAFAIMQLNVRANGDVEITEANTSVFREHMRESFQRKLRTFADANFYEIFPEGITGTDLSDYDVENLVDIFMGLPLMIDGDMGTIRFAFNPNIVFRVGCFPKEFMPFFYSHLAAKSAMSLANLSIPEWRDWFHMYFYHRQQFERTSPLAVGIAVAAVMNSMRLFEIERPRTQSEAARTACGDSGSRQTFYQYCLDIERRGFTPATCENSINIEFQRGELLGQGGFGKVYRVTNVETGQFLALKEIPLDDSKDNSIRAEIMTLKRLSHKNIVKYYGARFDRERKRVGILMEYLPRNLREVATASAGGLSLKLVATYGTMILEGLAYLHDHGIIHRDIKSANVLLSSEGIAKLTDFGTAMPSASATEVCRACDTELAALDEETREELQRQRAMVERRQGKQQIVGTPLFLDPSVLRGALPSEASDIWAIGCLFIELVTGRSPWQELSGLPMELVLYRISSATAPPQLPADIDVTPAFRAMLARALALNPFDRPSARELLEDPFFTQSSGLGSGNGSLVANSSGKLLSIEGSSPGLTVNSIASSSSSASFNGNARRSTEVVGPSANRSASVSGSSGPRSNPGTETTITTTNIIGSPHPPAYPRSGYGANAPDMTSTLQTETVLLGSL